MEVLYLCLLAFHPCKIHSHPFKIHPHPTSKVQDILKILKQGKNNKLIQDDPKIDQQIKLIPIKQ